jgi:23S rRNA (uridine2552-2'-O)-methyltransferase
MAKSSKEWLQRHVSDHYVKKARKEGYRSRAAYKLIEIDQKHALFKPGMTVLDLGAAPGGWSQVAAQKVKPGGKVTAIDVVDLVLSDVAPNLSGIPNVDQARLLELAGAAIQLCRKVLKRDGVLLVKAFHGEAFDEVREELNKTFLNVKVVKPPASRGESAETYVVARGLRGL